MASIQSIRLGGYTMHECRKRARNFNESFVRAPNARMAVDRYANKHGRMVKHSAFLTLDLWPTA